VSEHAADLDSNYMRLFSVNISIHVFFRKIHKKERIDMSQMAQNVTFVENMQ